MNNMQTNTHMYAYFLQCINIKTTSYNDQFLTVSIMVMILRSNNCPVHNLWIITLELITQ